MTRFVLPLLLALLGCSDPPPPVAVNPEPEAPRVQRPAGLPEGEAVGPAPTVELFPTTGEVPANRPRFQLLWSEPIRVAPHGLRILDEDGHPLPGTPPTLSWDDRRQVATLEPKMLVPGRAYTLRVEGFWSERGGELASQDLAILVRSTDLEPPDARHVRIESALGPGTSDPIVFRFPEPMDRNAPRGITVLAAGRAWPGRWAFADGETVLRFEPGQPWPAGGVTVSLAGGITDLAGNELVNRPMSPVAPAAPSPEVPRTTGVSMEGM